MLLGGDGRPYAVALDGPNIARPLRGRSGLREQLAKAYADSTGGTVPSASALADALAVLDGHARGCDPEPVELWLATHGDGIVLDLGTADGRCVLAGPAGWRVESTSPVLFRRTALTGPLPNPERGGTLNPLRGLLNVDDAGWHLLLGWTVAALLPRLPHPVLALLGEQGTAKSTTARLLVDLLDPSPAPLRSCPRDLRQWAVTASASWAVMLDNVSSVPGWLSDILCRAVTGDGIVDRALYTDDDVSVLSFRRVVAITSIDAGALSGDLAERLLPVELQRIPTDRRRTEAEINAAFEEARPQLLGGLLDLLADVLAVLPSVQLVESPRMADFARVLAALDVVLGSHTIKTYSEAAQHVAEAVVESDPFAEAVHTLAASGWTGTATELLDAVTPERPPRGWPTSARGVAGALRRVVPALRATGVEVTFERVGKSNTRSITLAPADGADANDPSDGRSHSLSGRRRGREAAPADGADGRDHSLSVQVMSTRAGTGVAKTSEGSRNRPSAPSAPSATTSDLHEQADGRADGRAEADGRADGTDTQPETDLFAAGFALPSAPATPTPCRICGVELTLERAGRYDRCEPCWDALLAAQPPETRRRRRQ